MGRRKSRGPAADNSGKMFMGKELEAAFFGYGL